MVEMKEITFFTDELIRDRILTTYIQETDFSVIIKQDYNKKGFENYESDNVIINKKHLKQLIDALNDIYTEEYKTKEKYLNGNKQE